MFMDLKGLGTDHMPWCWGTEEDLNKKLHAMAQQDLTDIATYRLNRLGANSVQSKLGGGAVDRNTLTKVVKMNWNRFNSLYLDPPD